MAWIESVIDTGVVKAVGPDRALEVMDGTVWKQGLEAWVAENTFDIPSQTWITVWRKIGKWIAPPETPAITAFFRDISRSPDTTTNPGATIEWNWPEFDEHNGTYDAQIEWWVDGEAIPRDTTLHDYISGTPGAADSPDFIYNEFDEVYARIRFVNSFGSGPWATSGIVLVF